MNYQKIGKLCKKTKMLYIMETNDQQWVGDGIALYAVEGMPRMKPEQLCRFLALDMDKVHIFEKSSRDLSTSLEDLDEDEEMIDGNAIRCCIAGRDAVVFPHRNGAICVDSKRLEPFEKAENVEYYKREKVLAVKVGLYIEAIIAPLILKGGGDAEVYADLANRLAVSRAEEEAEESKDDV